MCSLRSLFQAIMWIWSFFISLEVAVEQETACFHICFPLILSELCSQIAPLCAVGARCVGACSFARVWSGCCLKYMPDDGDVHGIHTAFCFFGRLILLLNTYYNYYYIIFFLYIKFKFYFLSLSVSFVVIIIIIISVIIINNIIKSVSGPLTTKQKRK